MARIQHMFLALVLAGCVADDGDAEAGSVPPEPPDLPYEYTTEHLEIHSDRQRCGNDLARWEGFSQFVVDYLGLPDAEPADLYVWDDKTFDAEAICHGPFGGCFWRSHGGHGIAYSSVGSVEHELVHALTQEYETNDSFFKEGLADALSSPNLFGLYGPVFPVSRSSKVDYRSAGHFVRWLLDTRGLALLLKYMTQESSVAAFEQLYGVELAALTDEYFAEAQAWYPRLYEYGAPSLDSIAEGVWSSDLVFSCERQDVRGLDPGLGIVRELTVLEAGSYAFWTSTGGAIEVRMVAGADVETATQERKFRIPPGQIALGLISPGTYELEIAAPPGVETGTVMVWKSESLVPSFPEIP